MPRPNLSTEAIALAIAALGTTAALAACTKTAEPAAVKADRAPAPMSSAAPGATAAPPAGPGLQQPDPAAKDLGARGGAEAIREESRAAPKAAAAASEVPPPAERSRRSRGATGQASCGAGTCTADMKKK